jgi:protein TonB
MAPGEVKVNAFPDTLPEDFAEWDGGGAQPTVVAPVKQASATSARPAETRPPATARVVAPDREIERSMPQPVVRAPKPVPPPAAKAAVEQTWQPAPRARQQSAPAKPDFAPPSTQRNAEAKLAEALWPEAEQKKKAKAESGTRGHRTVAVAVGVVVLCAGLGAGGYMMYIWRSHAQQHPQTATDTSTANASQPGTSPDAKPDPRNATAGTANPQTSASAQKPGAQGSPSDTQQSSADATSSDTAPQQNAAPSADMSQFTAAPSIPHNSPGASAPEPANLDASHMGGGNSGANPMFNTSSKEHVQFAPSKPIEVASGALTSTLVKKTMPEYPQIARNMHVSGVVTVAITITPQGTVAEAHAVSGPVLLRPSAVEAVKSWRFKPYLVNNRPVAVQSNVNVDFSLQ